MLSTVPKTWPWWAKLCIFLILIPIAILVGILKALNKADH